MKVGTQVDTLQNEPAHTAIAGLSSERSCHEGCTSLQVERRQELRGETEVFEDAAAYV